MRCTRPRHIAGHGAVAGWHATLATTLALFASGAAGAQTLATLQGRVLDQSEAVVPGAAIRVEAKSIGFAVSVGADSEGRYIVFGIPSGQYTVTAEADGFRPERIGALNVDVGRTLVRDFHLVIGDLSETVLVRTAVPVIDR